MNKERLQIVRDAIAAHPDNFHYGVVVMVGDVPSSPVTPDDRTPALESLARHDCGTVGCVAGFTLAIAKERNWPHDGNWMEDAKELLELTTTEEHFLFNGSPAFGFPDIRADLGMSGANLPEAIERLDFLIAQCDKD